MGGVLKENKSVSGYYSYYDEYELMKKILYSKFGLLPLLMKFVFFSSVDKNVKIFEFNSQKFKGFIIKGEKFSRNKGNFKIFRIFLYAKVKKKCIEMIIIGKKIN